MIIETFVETEVLEPLPMLVVVNGNVMDVPEDSLYELAVPTS